MKRDIYDLLTPICQVVTYALLIAAVLVLVSTGSRLYQKVTENKNRNEHLRSTLFYIQNQVSANDCSGVSVEAGPEGDMLVFPVNGTDYRLCVYASGGSLYEELTDDADVDPAKSDKISDVSEFSITHWDGRGLLVTVDGGSAWVTLRSDPS